MNGKRLRDVLRLSLCVAIDNHRLVLSHGTVARVNGERLCDVSRLSLCVAIDNHRLVLSRSTVA